MPLDHASMVVDESVRVKCGSLWTVPECSMQNRRVARRLNSMLAFRGSLIRPPGCVFLEAIDRTLLLVILGR